MEISRIEKTRKRLFAFLCLGFSIPVAIGFAIVHSVEGKKLETTNDILIGIVLVVAFIGLKKLDVDLFIYRLGLGLVSAGLSYGVSIGAGYGYAVYWLFPLPLVFMFFLGKIEGITASIIFFIILSVLLFNPFSLEIYPYRNEASVRFLVALFFIALIAYALETSREKFGSLLIENQAKLLEEKENLDKALREIKKLTGLIPICSHCKKVRDDEGYWQQVEIYIRDHSEAKFTHGICPDCLQKLYPDFKHVREK